MRIATGEEEEEYDTPEAKGKDPAAVSMGQRGGKARAEIAKKAAASKRIEFAYFPLILPFPRENIWGANRRLSMPVADQEQVKLILESFEERIRLVVDKAWKEWLDLPDRGRFLYVKRIRANLVFDAVARHAQIEFAGDKNIHVISKSQTIQFLFKDQVLLRFKQANGSGGVGSNIETQAVLDFIDPQRNIPNLLPDVLKVEVCWLPDDLGLKLEEVAVIARDRKRRVWAYPLDKRGGGADVIPLPTNRGPDGEPPLVLPRNVDKKDGSKG